MIEIQIGNPSGVMRSVILDKISTGFEARIKQAMIRVGAIFERQIKKNLSGPSHTRFPGASNPFPGVLTGTLRRSVTSQAFDQGFAVRIGPNTEYAAIHEFGGRAGRGGSAQIPPRPYMKPAFDDKVEEAVDQIEKAAWAL